MAETYSELRIASFSDLHLGHPNNTPEEMIPSLKSSLPLDRESALLDVVVLAGDIYDHQLPLPHADVATIDEWIVWKLRQCKKLDIALWVLRGTPSHDVTQPERFDLLNKAMDIGCDLTYVDELKIVWMPKFGIHVLFVPDEWTDSAEKTLEEVHQLLRIAGIKKVDYAIMHGQFEYQLPAVVKAQKHNAEAYLSIVDKLIFIGHVHQFSRFERIIAQGSHNRMTQGDEKPKGHVRAIVRSSDDYEITFVENTDAKIFKTINCRGLDYEQSYEKVINESIDYPDGSFLRILADLGNPILQAVSTIEKIKPYYRWSSLAKADDDKSFIEQTELLQSKQEYIPIELNKNNIEKLLIDKLLFDNVDPAVIKLAEIKLAELVR